MSEDGKKAIVENVSRETLERAIEEASRIEKAEPAGKPAAPKKIPTGHVERVLNMRDRNFLIGACRAYCETAKHRKFKDQEKLDRLKKLLSFEETLDYMAMIDDSLDDERRKWRGAQNRYKFWLSLKEGAANLDDLKKEYPGVDFVQLLDAEEPPAKPRARPPEHPPETLRGPERPFYLPSKLDAFAEEALRRMDWSTDMNEGSVEVCRKYAIEREDGEEAETESVKEE